MPRFREFFRRPSGHENLEVYDDLVVSSDAPKDVAKFGQLYADCFGHHIQPEVDGRHDSLEVTLADNKRIIQSDNLTSRFVRHYYRPPIISRTPNRSEAEQRDFIIGLDEVVRFVTDTPMPSDWQASGNLGSNRFCYLIGDVGVGKTLLSMKLLDEVRTLPPDPNGFRLVPVYMDFERLLIASDGRLQDIAEEFFAQLCEATVRSVTSTISELAAVQDLPTNRDFRLICKVLSTLRVRLLIVFDNTDRYHFYYSKYSFFDEQYQAQMRSVRDNFRRLINAFIDTTSFGNLGLCVLLVCRRYVFDECRRHSDGANPMNMIHADHEVFQLLPVTEQDVVEARFDLFKEAVIAIGRVQSATSKDYAEQLSRLRIAFVDSLSDSRGGYHSLHVVRKLSHHGLRSFVAFLGQVRIDYRSSYDVVQRLFKDQPDHLVRLYMTNLRKRFTQKLGHFPNLFLNDAVVGIDGKFPEVHRPHVHTYWLKYLLLKHITEQGSGRATFDELRELFVVDGGFQEHAFRLALGSLCTVDESWCLDVEYVGSDSYLRRVRATDRGRFLVSDAKSRDWVEFCLTFEYLQLVIDDYWLSFPEPWYSDIYVHADLGYSLKDAGTYGKENWEYLRQKSKAVLYFLRVLEASYQWEQSQRPKLFAAHKGRRLEFGIIAESLLDEYEGIFGGGSRKYYAVELRETWIRLQRDRSFDAFFQAYTNAGRPEVAPE